MRVWAACALVLLATSAFGRGSLGATAPQTIPQPEPTHTPQAAISAAQEGQALFVRVGCAGCHGEKAGGGFGPALAGRTAEQIRSQVRNPRGLMPAFSPATLSDDDLEKIIVYIQSLDGGGREGLPGWPSWIPIVAMGAMVVFMFLMMGRGGFGPRCLRPRMRARRRRRRETALEILRKRYARGEITREEFHRMKEEM
ncbi:MAG: c-type cytochrome [Anaerolineae bacterium]